MDREAYLDQEAYIERASYLKAIRDNPNDDKTRGDFADWLDGHGASKAAARQRWWCRIRVRLFEGIRLESDADLNSLGAALSGDGWRWRLGSLAAIWVAENYYTPHFNPATWPEGWSADRFLSALHEYRYTIEAVALGALPQIHLAETRRRANEASDAARELIGACPQDFDSDTWAWMQACEVQHMATRTVALTKDWSDWEYGMQSEGGIAGELMQATATAFEIILAEPLPEAELPVS